MGRTDITIRETLLRIAVLLCWLAGHADRAASVSPALRRTVLHILRQGEFATLDLLFDLLRTGAFPSFEDYWDAVESDEPVEAMLLAARLRLFALAVTTIALRMSNDAGPYCPNAQLHVRAMNLLVSSPGWPPAATLRASVQGLSPLFQDTS